MNSPRVSVVMSVYNGATFLADSVNSILNQTYANFEFIIVNDGSTDNSLQILQQIALTDSRIQVIDQPNSGLTRALVAGCQLARGEFIARQDDDDESRPERLAKQVQFLDAHATVGFVACATRYLGPRGEHLELASRSESPEIATRQLLMERGGPPAHGSVMFRRSVYERLGGYRTEFYFSQDSDLWLRMAEHVQFACVPEELYAFRKHGDSITSVHRETQSAFGRLGQKCKEARLHGLPEVEYLKEAEAISAQLRLKRRSAPGKKVDTTLYYMIGSRLAREGQRAAREYLWPVVLRKPWHWKAWIRLIQSYWTQITRRSEKIHQ